MHEHDDEMTRVFARDMDSAERGRSRLLIGAVSLAVVGVAMIAAVLLFARPTKSAPVADKAEIDAVLAPPSAAEPAAPPAEQAEAATNSVKPKADSDTPIDESSKPEAKAETIASKPKTPAPKPSLQKVSIAIGDVGYEPAIVTVKAGSPVQLTIGKGEGCAAGFLMPELGVEADNSARAATVKLGVLEEGTYRFTCAMEMVEGRLVVE